MTDDKIENDGVVYTSGTGGIFKSGIPIGKVKNNEKKNIKEVKFFSELSQLTFVKVVSFNKQDN